MENVLLDAVDDPSLPEIASGPAPPVTLSELVVSGLVLSQKRDKDINGLQSFK